MKTAIELIKAERERQVSAKGWSAGHDDEHIQGELANAAACYALDPSTARTDRILGWAWPFDAEWFKPTPEDRIRELVKAGALIVAEIERLQREGEKE
jgi:hypothetical protein